MTRARRISPVVFAIALAPLLGRADTTNALPVEHLLNGRWDFQPVQGKRLGAAPGGGRWQPAAIAVPGVWSDRESRDRGYPTAWDTADAAWYRRSFTVPAEWRGRTLVLRFGQVDYDATVFVNGQRVGSHRGFSAFEVDITRAVSGAGSNTLVVGVVNWSAAIDGEGLGSALKKVTPLVQARITAPVSIRSNPVVPNGGGIAGDVRLVGYPVLRIQDVAIRPSFRKKTLETVTRIVNRGTAPATAVVRSRVVDGERDVMTFANREVTIAAGAGDTIASMLGWPAPVLWSPDAPHLYRLVTTISVSGRVVAEHSERFGFRELWVDGPDLFLNGAKLVLRATTDGYHFFFWSNRVQDAASPAPAARDGVRIGLRDGFERLRRMNVNTVRIPMPTSSQLDLADEMGLLVVSESMVSGVLNEIPAAERSFWDESRRQIEEWVVEQRNHPSVVIWSVENEVLMAQRGDPRLVPPLVALGRQIRALDPTRPLMYEGDGDPGGEADLINVHYPHRGPSDACRLRLSPRGQLALDSYPFTLASGKKPLYIGEFGWSLARGFYEPAEYTQFIREYRQSGVAGIAPFLMQEASAAAFSPLAAFVRDCSSAEGGPVASVHNDSLRPASVRVVWRLERGGRVGSSGQRVLQLAPGESSLVSMQGDASVDASGTQATVELHRGAALVFSDTKLLRGRAR